MLAEYTLIGGNALSLSIGHRLSEDLDFCTWDKPIYDVTPDEIQTFIRHLSTPSALDLTPSSFEILLSLKRNHKNIEYHTAEPKLEFKNIGLGL
jgi:hypothetical protein